ncbi:MAG: FkbM family methyltransferase, partial [Chitinophagaceae bacterium]
FYKNGGRGVCVEPNPALHNQIQAKRKRDVCLNAGIATNGLAELDFYIIDSHTLSTFSKEDAESLTKEGTYKIQEVVKVPVFSINEVLEKYFEVRNIDLLSLDVEGLNEEIIASLDLVKFRPKVLCIETLTFSNGNQGNKIKPIAEKLVANGYFAYADTYLNTIFIDKAIWK